MRATILALLVASLLSCSSSGNQVRSLAPGELIGAWCGTGGDRLELAEDKFVLTPVVASFIKVIFAHYSRNADRMAAYAEQVASSLDEGKGSWNSYPSSSKTLRVGLQFDNIHPPDVESGLQTPAPYPAATELAIYKIDGQLALLAWASDPDQGYEYKFVKCP